VKKVADLDPHLVTALSEHSPRLVITTPTLLPAANSPTGWIVVVPDPWHAPSAGDDHG
jgi:hypothetical protein